jgi:hypothetical protein
MTSTQRVWISPQAYQRPALVDPARRRHRWRRSKWATTFDLVNVVLLVVLLIVVVAGA